MTTPDVIAAGVYTALSTSVTKPTGLTVYDHDVLPVETDSLPAVGVYLATDRASDLDLNSATLQGRVATVRVEIRAVGATVAGTTTIRAWAIKTVLESTALLQVCDYVTFGEFSPFGIASNVRISGADLDFEIGYIFDPS